MPQSIALASISTGCSLAYAAANLAVNYGLASLRSSVIRVTTACFEPALYYVVAKAPRWDFRKL